MVLKYSKTRAEEVKEEGVTILFRVGKKGLAYPVAQW